FLFVFGKAVGAEVNWLAIAVATKQHKVAIVGNEDLAVLFPIFCDLLRCGGDPCVVFGGLDLDCAASRFLAGDGVFVFEFLKLASFEKAAVRVTGTTIL